jgi:hypothetical protein
MASNMRGTSISPRPFQYCDTENKHTITLSGLLNEILSDVHLKQFLTLRKLDDNVKSELSRENCIYCTRRSCNKIVTATWTWRVGVGSEGTRVQRKFRWKKYLCFVVSWARLPNSIETAPNRTNLALMAYYPLCGCGSPGRGAYERWRPL